ncbi:myb-like protein P [Ceratina calcarata]|uniref:Myb-like protein P n=1 Tax=Ceratina calcarata TaxID=156304 RepID=A0AAJ7S3J9_9HYME|nr:myb-like protein P [Ceratina calcarata]
MCQQLSQGLSLLSSSDDFGPITTQSTSSVAKQLFKSTVANNTPPASSNSLEEMTLQNGPSLNNNNNNNNNDKNEDLSNLNHVGPSWRETSPVLASNHRLTPILNKTNNISPILPRTNTPTSIVMSTPAPATSISAFGTSTSASPAFSTASTSSLGNVATPAANRSPIPVTSALVPMTTSPSTSVVSTSSVLSNSIVNDASQITQAPVASTISTPAVQPVATTAALPKPEQWLGSITGSAPVQSPSQGHTSPRRAPPLHARALSLGSAAMGQATRTGPSDPFDAEWAEIAARNLRQASTTNPFIMPNATQAFQVQL